MHLPFRFPTNRISGFVDDDQIFFFDEQLVNDKLRDTNRQPSILEPFPVLKMKLRYKKTYKTNKFEPLKIIHGFHTLK